MTRLILVTIAISILFFSAAPARDLIDNYSAVQMAMGRTSLSLINTAHVIAVNPALLRATTQYTIAANYQEFYDIPDIYLIDGGASYNGEWFAVGLLLSYFGDLEIYQERRGTVGLSFSPHQLVSLGVNLDFSSISFDERFDALSEFSYGIGAAVHFENFILHAAASELNSPRLTTSDRKTKPGYRLGMHLTNNDNLCFNIEASGRGERDPQYHFGQEFRFEKIFFLRLGIVTNPSQPAAGLGIMWDWCVFHYALNDNSELGQTHTFGVSIIL